MATTERSWSRGVARKHEALGRKSTPVGAGLRLAWWSAALRDKLARKLEEHADEVVAAYLAGIRSDDPNRAYRAADAWISRVHGRPKETVENVTVPDDPLDIASMTREERDALKRRLVAENPDVARQLGLVREDVA